MFIYDATCFLSIINRRVTVHFGYIENWKMVCDTCSKTSIVVVIVYASMININIANEGTSMLCSFSGPIDSWYKGIGIHNIKEFFRG